MALKDVVVRGNGGLLQKRRGNGATNVVADALDRLMASVTNVEKLSLATLCVLLAYIYTDEIDLRPANNPITIFRFPAPGEKKILLWIDELMGLSATREELLKIAIRYEIADLQDRCRQGIIDGNNKWDVIMDALFQKDDDPFRVYKDYPYHHDVLKKLIRLRINGC
ncbi:hypothetical protein BGX30_007350 [Mortierella sp. GBA39]|nr:hypothetical protein BGX30_007350 [Mortierella sp. GBA39]